jgi:propionate CoA-transferase
VAIIRGTTADAAGNITVEEESLLADQKIMAAAAKNSGGIVIAQVKRLAAKGSLPSRQVAVPGPLVDCVVVVDEKDHDTLHGMSFEERHNPALTGELVTPRDEILPMKLDIRKVIARRAFFALKPDKIVNLGIGMPEGVASVAAEEGMLDFVTLSTEPGSFGGLPASGKSFGPAFNASALVEMNQMFDFYDGGGLHICFLGAAQISPSGDVNVSRMAKNRLTGPGGFIDISQSTRDICFMTTLTAKGLEVSCPGDGSLKIDQEGKVKKFVPEVFEKTFSGDEAVRRGQKVFYVTERAVFRRTAKNDVIELIEVAEGVDVQKDVIDQMEFTPAISPNLKKMDPRIFKEEKMNVTAELFGSLEERCSYQKEDHTMFLDLFGINLNTKDDVDWFFDTLSCILEPLVRAKGPIDMVVQYDGFDIRQGLEDEHIRRTKELEDKYYKSVHRFTGTQFHRAKLAKNLKMSDWDPDSLYDEFDTNKDGSVSLEELRHGVKEFFEIRLSPTQLALFQKTPESTSVDRETFAKAVENLLKME